MEGGRFLAPSMGLFYLLVTAGLSRLASYNMRKFTLVSLLLIQFLVLGSFLHHKSTSLTGWQLLNRTEPDRYRNHPWVELGNKTNRRDVQALEKLSELGGLILRQQQTLTLMTGQAGLIGYYLAREFHPVLTFVDRRGLVSGHLMNCAREIGLNSSRFGLLFPWIFYLQNQRTMNQECFGVTPDLFYGMRESKNLNVKVLNKYGLEPVYFQPAEPLYPDDTLLPGYEKRAFLVVLLRNELVNKLSLQVKQEGRFRNYGILP